jgi:hypothetical protein
MIHHDPLERTYSNAETWERVLTALMWAAAVTCILSVTFAPADGSLSHALRAAFVWLVVLNFVLSLYARLWIFGLADENRRNLLISDSVGSPLTPEKAFGYYNNSERPSLTRLLFNLAENSFFSQELVTKEIKAQAPLTIILLVAFALLWRHGTIHVFEAAAIALVFTDQILGRTIRMFWMRSQYRRCYSACINELLGGPTDATAGLARAMALLCAYEQTKARGVVRPRDRTFKRHNASLTAEWNKRRSDVERARAGYKSHAARA